MGQKINPTGFRLGIIKDHRSRWYADTSRYPELLKEDFKIREFFAKNPKNLDNLKKPGISEIRIERKADQIDLEIRTSRPRWKSTRLNSSHVKRSRMPSSA